MAILEHEIRSADGSPAIGLRRYPITRQGYRAMGDAGAFGQSRVELIEGEVVEMAPVGETHAATPEPLVVALQAAFGDSGTVRNQAPIALGDDVRPSEPLPDVVVAAGSWRDYLTRHPGTADIRLIVEIADSSLAYDRGIKSRLYAAAMIPEYWILNLPERQLEVYRDPSSGGYGSSAVFHSGDSVQPLHAGGRAVEVAAFMP